MFYVCVLVRNSDNRCFFVLFALFYLCLAIKEWWKQARCSHENYRETMSCQAICKSCNKNLGFIGRVREKSNPKI